MALSGSRDFNLDAAEMIEEAFELIGLESRTGYDLASARRSMNIMFKEWGNRGINLWTISQDVEALSADQDTVTMDAGDLDVVDSAIRYDGRDYPLKRIVRSDYMNISDKDQEGRPSQIYVDRQRVQPIIYVWPVPATTGYSLITHRIRDIQDIDAATDDADVPSRFIAPAVAGIAYYMAMKRAPERMEYAKMHYDEVMAMAISEDSERGSLFIRPGRVC